MVPLPTTGWRNSSDTGLQKEDLRSVELLLKACDDPNHITMVGYGGKHYLLN